MWRVLLIDDDEKEKYLLNQLEGIEIDHVPTVESAQAAVQAASYDCVVIDLNMPPYQGLETVEAAKGIIDRYPTIVYTRITSPVLVDTLASLLVAVAIKGSDLYNLQFKILRAIRLREVLDGDHVT